MVSAEFLLPLRVYIEDTDTGGIVYYINYLKYMERARTEFMRSQGFDRQFIFNQELMFVVHSANVRYLRSAELDDELVASAQVIKVGKTYLDFLQRVTRRGDVLAEAEIRIACVSRESRRPTAIPKAMMAAIDREPSA